jgi:hypothetical protein
VILFTEQSSRSYPNHSPNTTPAPDMDSQGSRQHEGMFSHDTNFNEPDVLRDLSNGLKALVVANEAAASATPMTDPTSSEILTLGQVKHQGFTAHAVATDAKEQSSSEGLKHMDAPAEMLHENDQRGIQAIPTACPFYSNAGSSPDHSQRLPFSFTPQSPASSFQNNPSVKHQPQRAESLSPHPQDSPRPRSSSVSSSISSSSSDDYVIIYGTDNSPPPPLVRKILTLKKGTVGMWSGTVVDSRNNRGGPIYRGLRAGSNPRKNRLSTHARSSNITGAGAFTTALTTNGLIGGALEIGGARSGNHSSKKLQVSEGGNVYEKSSSEDGLSTGSAVPENDAIESDTEQIGSGRRQCRFEFWCEIEVWESK